MSCNTCKYFSGLSELVCAVNPMYKLGEVCKDYEEGQPSYMINYPLLADGMPVLEQYRNGVLNFAYCPTSLTKEMKESLRKLAMVNLVVGEFLVKVEEYNNQLQHKVVECYEYKLTRLFNNQPCLEVYDEQFLVNEYFPRCLIEEAVLYLNEIAKTNVVVAQFLDEVERYNTSLKNFDRYGEYELMFGMP